LSDLFSTDDLADHVGEILERVRSGREVRLYDPHGFDMTLVRTEEVMVSRQIAGATATLLGLLQARGRVPGGDEMTLVDYGSWSWLRHLGSEPLDQFLSEVSAAIVIACREGDAIVLQETLERWRDTAQTLGEIDPGPHQPQQGPPARKWRPPWSR